MDDLASRRLLSLAVFFGGIAILFIVEVAFDTWVAIHWGREATISDAMRAAPPIVVWAFGVLCGGLVGFLGAHFFWIAK